MAFRRLIPGVEHLAGGSIHNQGGILIRVSWTGWHAHSGAARGGMAMVARRCPGRASHPGDQDQTQDLGEDPGQEARPIR